ncbi:MAG: response regulator, partial [Proteobacteria bacterium]
VMVNLELLSRLVPSQPNTRQLIDAAMQSTRRGAALTQRLLAFSRRQELVLESHPLDRLIEGMRDLLQRSIGTTYELVLSLPAGLPPALVDANQIELAILNLVVNARDAMPEGGKLEVTLSRGLPPAELGIVCSEGACLCVAVTDSGLGMDADTLRRAKEPFFSTKPLGKGTGLGLSMIDGLARQLNGALHLQSTPGHGTRAELWLPAAPRSAATAESLGEQKASEPTPMDPLHVLVVDDDAAVAEGTRGLLGSLGHRVTVADSGEKALAMLDASQVPDVLITDYAMPHMTGAQLATIVRKRFPDMPVILASGYADTPAEFDPALPRLHKPYERHALAEMLRTTQPGTSSRAS